MSVAGSPVMLVATPPIIWIPTTQYPAQSGSASEERHDEPSSSRPVRQTYLQ